MVSEPSNCSRVYLATTKPEIPNEDLRRFIIGVEALLGMGGTFRDGFVSAGLPNTCPYDDAKLGYGVNGDGEIGEARDMYQAWHAIGAWNRGICAAFYRAPGAVGLNVIACKAKLSDELFKLAKANEKYSGVFVAMELSGKKLSHRAAELEVEAAHVAWAIELDRAERASDAQWKTGAL